MPQDPKHASRPSTSNSHEGRAEYLVQAGQVSGDITINAGPPRRRRWSLIGTAGAAIFVVYLLLANTTTPPAQSPATGQPTKDQAAGQFQLRSIESNLCVALPGNTGPVKQLPCDSASSAQLWSFKTVDTSGPEDLTMFSRTKDRDTEICLDLPGTGSQPDGTQVLVTPCESDPRADNQLWTKERGDEDALFRISNPDSDDRCLSPRSPQSGEPLVIKDCAKGHGSQWQFLSSGAVP